MGRDRNLKEALLQTFGVPEGRGGGEFELKFLPNPYKQISVDDKGMPKITFSKFEMQLFSQELQFTLVEKFS